MCSLSEFMIDGALTDQATCPVTVRLTAGQAGDNPQLVPLLDLYDAARTADGVGKDTFRLLADNAYSSLDPPAAPRPPDPEHHPRTNRPNEPTNRNAARTKDPKADDHPHSTTVFRGFLTWSRRPLRARSASCPMPRPSPGACGWRRSPLLGDAVAFARPRCHPSICSVCVACGNRC